MSITVTDHSYADDFTTDTYPTCTEPGEKSRHCTYPGCDSRGEITAIPALGHVDGEYTVTVAPTCTAAGTKVGYCTRCGKEASIPIPPLGHDWGSWIVEPAATCTDNGEEHRFCTRCGEISRQVIQATGHSFSAIFSIDVPATCTTAGSKSRHCLNPGCEAKIDNTVVEVLPHPWGAWETTEESTCIEIGKQHRLCAVCGAEEIADVPLKAHSYAVEFTVDSEPTCSTEGSKSRHCTTPGCTAKTDVTSIATVAHPYGDWITDTSSTCSTAGTKHRICTQCGAREDGTIAKKGHNYTSYLYSEATCTSPAQYYDSCTRCGASTGVYSSGSALEHSWGSYTETKSATCTTAGSKSRTCSRCGATDTATIAARGHNFSTSYTIDKAATCTTAGSKSKHCTRVGCGATTGSTSIPAKHSYEITGYSPYSGTQHTVNKKCKICGDVNTDTKSGHTNVSSDTHRCSACGGYAY